jgi:hypothetical protein
MRVMQLQANDLNTMPVICFSFDSNGACCSFVFSFFARASVERTVVVLSHTYRVNYARLLCIYRGANRLQGFGLPGELEHGGR